MVSRLGSWQGKKMSIGGTKTSINSSLPSVTLNVISVYKISEGLKTKD